MKPLRTWAGLFLLAFCPQVSSQTLFAISEVYHAPTNGQVVVFTYQELDYLANLLYAPLTSTVVSVNNGQQNYSFQVNPVGDSHVATSTTYYTVPPGATVNQWTYSFVQSRTPPLCGINLWCDYMGFLWRPPAIGFRSIGITTNLQYSTSPSPILFAGYSYADLGPSPVSSLSELQTCLDDQTKASCSLAPGTYHFGPGQYVQSIRVRRAGVLLDGGGSQLMRDPGYHGTMISVAIPEFGPDSFAQRQSPAILERLTIRNNGHLACSPEQDISSPCPVAFDVEIAGAETGNYAVFNNVADAKYVVVLNRIKITNSVRQGLYINANNGKTNGIKVVDCDFVADPSDPLLPAPGVNFDYTAAPHYLPAPTYNQLAGPPKVIGQVAVFFQERRYFGGKVLILPSSPGWDDTRNCDNNPSFPDDPGLLFPRNIWIDGSRFTSTNQGSLAGMARRWHITNNQFINDDEDTPAAGADGDQGGIVLVDACSDRVVISRNVIVGSNATFDTSGLELAGRNTIVDGNDISNVAAQGIGASNTFQLAVYNNRVHNNSRVRMVKPLANLAGLQVFNYQESTYFRATTSPFVSNNFFGNSPDYLPIVPPAYRLPRPATQAVGLRLGASGPASRTQPGITYCSIGNTYGANLYHDSCHRDVVSILLSCSTGQPVNAVCVPDVQ